MKLKNKYGHGNIEKSLKFMHPKYKGIALEFAYRLAAYVEYVAGKTKRPDLIMKISSGFRDTAYQKTLYTQNIKQYPPSGNGKVAVPGNSWHEARCAVDVDDEWWHKYLMDGDFKKPVEQQELNKFGLCMPLNSVEAKTHEWWHLQPIETLDWTDPSTRKAFLDYDDPLYNNATLTVYEFQAIMGVAQDGKIGPKTKAAAVKAKTMPMYSASKVKKVVDKILKK